MRSRLFALVVAATLSAGALAGDLRAYFDRQSVYEGDSVTLVIETGSGTLGQPDLSVLGPDFDLLGTSQSTNISIINGKRTDTIRLLVSLAPRRTGRIDVPPIQVGDERTEPLSLKVQEIPEDASGGGGDDIFVEMEVGADSGQLLVQQQVGLRVRLFTAVALSEGNLEDPRADGALVTKLGEDRSYNTNRNGRDYQVVERRYSLSPERSGELRVPPVRFEGRLRAGNGPRTGSRGSLFDDPFFDRFFQGGPLSRDPFGMLDRGKPVTARSRGISLEVKARPGDYSGDHWLPAEELVILDSWAENPPDLHVGEPATRVLTLQAKGLSGPQIPQIEIPEVSGLRIYPEKSDSESRSDGETVYGVSRQRLTLIPARAGAIEVPEIQVLWWDTVAERERIARVPGWTLKVAGEGSAGAEPQPSAPQEATGAPKPQDPAAARLEPRAGESASSGPLSEGIDRRYLIGAVVLLLLASTWVWRRARRRITTGGLRGDTASIRGNDSRARASAAKAALRAACEANDPGAAASALLDWADATWSESAPRDLAALATRIAAGAVEVRNLEQHLYGPAPGRWSGADLWRVLEGGLTDSPARGQQRDQDLDPLYPHRG